MPINCLYCICLVGTQTLNRVDKAIQVGGPAFRFENLTAEISKIVNKKNN